MKINHEENEGREDFSGSLFVSSWLRLSEEENERN
jgi:hypothetical protein